MLKGNIAKFSHNIKLKQYLLGTKNRTLVQVNPVNRIWGIGLSQESEKCKNPLEWKGLSLLEFTLMQVREQIENN